MLDVSKALIWVAALAMLVAFCLYLVVFTAGKAEIRSSRDDKAVDDRGAGWLASWLTIGSLVSLTLAIIARWTVTGHPPMSNGYEFALTFSWATLAAYVVLERLYRTRALSILVLPVALGMIAYAVFAFGKDSNPKSLLPALQNGPLLFLHVITCTLAYGGAAVGGAAGILYLMRDKLPAKFNLPSQERLEELGYRAIVFAYPMLTLGIILGAVWANVAWNRYWNWDPKETSSLVVWLIYGGYLHARVMRDWRGNKAAWILVLGFAAVLFTFFGNMFLGGLHSYGK